MFSQTSQASLTSHKVINRAKETDGWNAKCEISRLILSLDANTPSGTAFQELCFHCTLERLEKTFHSSYGFICDDNFAQIWLRQRLCLWWYWMMIVESMYRKCDDKRDCSLLCIIVCWTCFPFSSVSKSCQESAKRDIFHFNIPQIVLRTALQTVVVDFGSWVFTRAHYP